LLAGLLAAAAALGQGEPPQAETAPELAPRLSQLQGQASIDRRTDVIGATVIVRPQADRAKLYLTSSGEDGEFRIDDLPDGEYSILLTREGFEPVFKNGVELRFPFRAVVELTMTPGGSEAQIEQTAAESSGAATTAQVTVLGRILERGTGPLEEVRVRFTNPAGKQDPRSLRTRDDGSFEMADLVPGAWRVEILGVGFLPLRQVVDLRENTELTIYLVRQPAGYEPSPLELMPPEQPIPPDGWAKVALPV
jgi:hypothetical protein